MPSGSLCVPGTKYKHAFVIPTLNLFPKTSFSGELWNSLSKRFETFFLLLIQRSKIFTAFAVIEPSNVKCCKYQPSVPFPKKTPNPNKKPHCDASCLHMKSFSFLSLGQITQASLVPEEMFLSQPNFWVLSFSSFPLLFPVSLFLCVPFPRQQS